MKDNSYKSSTEKIIKKDMHDKAAEEHQKGIKSLMKILGDIFVPIIPVIAATGLFLGGKGLCF